MRELAVRLRVLSRAHRAFGVVLLLGVVARIACVVAYWPGLFYSDSWSYLRLAYAGGPVGFLPDRPSGYPLLIRLLTLPARQVAIVTTLQHLAGLLIATLLYALLLRAGARRWLAVAAASLALLDGDLIVLEQYVMADTFFALCLVLSAYFALARPMTVGRLAVSGAFLGAALPIRAAGLPAIPLWLLFVLRSRPPTRAVIVAALALLAPPLGYGALQEATGNGSPLNTSDGWFLYGRVAGFANCADGDIPAAARPLCPTGSERGWSGPRYIWAPSPATRRFPGGPSARNARANSLLGQFALGVIRDQPLTYAWTVSKDVLRLFATDGGTAASDLLELPTVHGVVAANASHDGLRHRYFSNSPPSRIQFPASLFRYYRYMCAPGLLTVLLLVVATVAIVKAAARRGRNRAVNRAWQIFLLSGSALAVTAGAVATTGPDYRYLLVTLPLLAAGGALALEELIPSYAGPAPA